MTEPRRHAWDYLLMMATVGALVLLGMQSLIGTIYSWWAYRTIQGWEQVGQPQFISQMNAIAAPLVIFLVVVMGLCVPKRLVSRRALVIVSIAMLVTSVAAGLAMRSAQTGLTVYLALSAAVQTAVVILTAIGSGGVTLMKGTRVAKVGSGLLHLGFIGFALTVVALQDSSLMLPGFLLSGVLLTGGSAMSFYGRGRTAIAGA